MRPPMRLSAAAPVRAQAEQDAPVREPITSDQALRLYQSACAQDYQASCAALGRR